MDDLLRFYDRATVRIGQVSSLGSPSTGGFNPNTAPLGALRAHWHVTGAGMIRDLVAMGRTRLQQEFPNVPAHIGSYLRREHEYINLRARVLPITSELHVVRYFSEVVDSFLARLFWQLSHNIGNFINEDEIEAVSSIRPDGLWFRGGLLRVILEHKNPRSFQQHLTQLPEYGEGAGRPFVFAFSMPAGGNAALMKMAVSLLSRDAEGRGPGGPHLARWGIFFAGRKYILCRVEELTPPPNRRHTIVTSPVDEIIGEGNAPFLAVCIALLLVGADELPLPDGLKTRVLQAFEEVQRPPVNSSFRGGEGWGPDRGGDGGGDGRGKYSGGGSKHDGGGSKGYGEGARGGPSGFGGGSTHHSGGGSRYKGGGSRYGQGSSHSYAGEGLSSRGGGYGGEDVEE